MDVIKHGVSCREEISDGPFRILHAVKDATSHCLLAEFFKPVFDEVEPTRTGGNEVQYKALMFGQPAANPLMAVGAVVIEDQVRGDRAGKLLITVVRITLADDAPLNDLERDKQGGRAVTLVVMGEGAAPSRLPKLKGRLC